MEADAENAAAAAGDGGPRPQQQLEASPSRATAAARAERDPRRGGARHEEPAGKARALSLSDLVAGTLTSALYTTASYPVHRVKVLIQTQDANPRILAGAVERFSFARAFGRLLEEQGMAGLWRGNLPYLLRHVPSVALSFTLKDAFREAFLPHTRGNPRWELVANAAAGGLAGALSLGVVWPFEWATVRMAADIGRGAADRQFGHSIRGAWLQAIRREGVFSVYRGFGTAAASYFLYKGLYFGLYDTAKPLLLGRDCGQDGGRWAATAPEGLLLRTGLAAATTLAAASISYPLDIVRKCLIVDTAADAPRYAGSFLRCVAEIARTEGPRGFYRFFAYDMAFRVFGGLVLVGYDVFGELLRREARANGTAAMAGALEGGAQARQLRQGGRRQGEGEDEEEGEGEAAGGGGGGGVLLLSRAQQPAAEGGGEQQQAESSKQRHQHKQQLARQWQRRRALQLPVAPLEVWQLPLARGEALVAAAAVAASPAGSRVVPQRL